MFDDIDTDMLPADTKEFSSSAHAQVAVTNDVYEHLGRPETFLFCPTGEGKMDRGGGGDEMCLEGRNM